jgi:hypothetical protein
VTIRSILSGINHRIAALAPASRAIKPARRRSSFPSATVAAGERSG